MPKQRTPKAGNTCPDCKALAFQVPIGHLIGKPGSSTLTCDVFNTHVFAL